MLNTTTRRSNAHALRIWWNRIRCLFSRPARSTRQEAQQHVGDRRFPIPAADAFHYARSADDMYYSAQTITSYEHLPAVTVREMKPQPPATLPEVPGAAA